MTPSFPIIYSKLISFNKVKHLQFSLQFVGMNKYGIVARTYPAEERTNGKQTRLSTMRHNRHNLMHPPDFDEEILGLESDGDDGPRAQTTGPSAGFRQMRERTSWNYTDDSKFATLHAFIMTHLWISSSSLGCASAIQCAEVRERGQLLVQEGLRPAAFAEGLADQRSHLAPVQCYILA